MILASSSLSSPGLTSTATPRSLKMATAAGESLSEMRTRGVVMEHPFGLAEKREETAQTSPLDEEWSYDSGAEKLRVARRDMHIDGTTRREFLDQRANFAKQHFAVGGGLHFEHQAGLPPCDDGLSQI